MENQPIVVSETNRPFWKLIVAALLFTGAIFIIIMECYSFQWSLDYVRHFVKSSLFIITVLIATAVGLATHKRVYIDLSQSRFKPTIEIGNFKYGKWKTIHNYEYISVFYDASKSPSEQFEVNLWYDSNQHFELYSRNNFEDALEVGFALSEELNIDLLDATIPHNFKWIDKEELKANAK